MTDSTRADQTERSPWKAVAILGAVVVVVSVIGNLSTSAGMDGWYESLDRPSWQPPGSVFGPVWGALYLTIIGAGVLAHREVGWDPTWIVPWAVQIVLNAGWSIVFFALESPNWAVAEIALLFAAVAWTIVACWRIRPLAGAILVPYLAWVGFAAALTVSIAVSN